MFKEILTNIDSHSGDLLDLLQGPKPDHRLEELSKKVERLAQESGRLEALVTALRLRLRALEDVRGACDEILSNCSNIKEGLKDPGVDFTSFDGSFSSIEQSFEQDLSPHDFSVSKDIVGVFGITIEQTINQLAQSIRFARKVLNAGEGRNLFRSQLDEIQALTKDLTRQPIKDLKTIVKEVSQLG